MKKIKYRNNNNYNNQVYSINYKFDSISPAGKCSGTALDLIKRYNELAKEAHSNGNYVEAEVFRQYAEHYRKIITEINERKNARFANKDGETSEVSAEQPETPAETPQSQVSDSNETSNTLVETKPTQRNRRSTTKTEKEPAETTEVLIETRPKTTKKSFKVIEISDKSSTPPHARAAVSLLKQNISETKL